MAEHKVLILGIDENDPLDYERAEMADLDVEFVRGNPQSEGEAMELVRDADALMMRSTPYQGEQVLRAAEKAQVLAVYSHGFNQIDTDVCNEMGIISHQRCRHVHGRGLEPGRHHDPCASTGNSFSTTNGRKPENGVATTSIRSNRSTSRSLG